MFNLRAQADFMSLLRTELEARGAKDVYISLHQNHADCIVSGYLLTGNFLTKFEFTVSMLNLGDVQVFRIADNIVNMTRRDAEHRNSRQDK